jgi:hypothetical protein
MGPLRDRKKVFVFVGEAQKRGRPKNAKTKTQTFFFGMRAKEEYVNEE